VTFKPEYLSLAINLTCTIYYAAKLDEPYKALYWFGCALASLALVGMKG
jgi:hypothetical protein